MKFEEEYINKIICGDCLRVMQKMPDKCIDLVVTSPPYNLKNSTGNGMKDGRGGKWAGAALVNGYSNYDDNMNNRNIYYRSTGVELTTDVHLLRFLIPFDLGIRSTFRPDNNSLSYEFLFAFNISGL